MRIMALRIGVDTMCCTPGSTCKKSRVRSCQRTCATAWSGVRPRVRPLGCSAHAALKAFPTATAVRSPPSFGDAACTSCRAHPHICSARHASLKLDVGRRVHAHFTQMDRYDHDMHLRREDKRPICPASACIRPNKTLISLQLIRATAKQLNCVAQARQGVKHPRWQAGPDACCAAGQETIQHSSMQQICDQKRTCDRNFQAAGAPDTASSARNKRAARSPAPSSSQGVAAAAAAPVAWRTQL